MNYVYVEWCVDVTWCLQMTLLPYRWVVPSCWCWDKRTLCTHSDVTKSAINSPERACVHEEPLLYNETCTVAESQGDTLYSVRWCRKNTPCAGLCRMRLGGREWRNDGHISGIQTHASVWLTTEAWRRRRLYGRRRRKHPWMGIEVTYCIYGRLITRIRLQQNWRAPAVLRRWTAMLTNAEHFFKCQFLHVFPYKFD